MAIVVIKGKGIYQYLRKGFNIVKRYQKDAKPNDDRDCFEFITRCKTKKQAEKQIKDSESLEIIEINNEPRNESE
tara:strand:- start:520 stop:744 length:225 start_codon:yes stop_codon:yes gene_type:complete